MAYYNTIHDIPSIRDYHIRKDFTRHAKEERNQSPMDILKDLKPGDRVYLSGDTKALWIRNYNVRVASHATVVEMPDKNAKKIMVNVDEIGGDHDVAVRVRRDRLLPPHEDTR